MKIRCRLELPEEDKEKGQDRNPDLEVCGGDEEI